VTGHKELSERANSLARFPGGPEILADRMISLASPAEMVTSRQSRVENLSNPSWSVAKSSPNRKAPQKAVRQLAQIDWDVREGNKFPLRPRRIFRSNSTDTDTTGSVVFLFSLSLSLAFLTPFSKPFSKIFPPLPNSFPHSLIFSKAEQYKATVDAAKSFSLQHQQQKAIKLQFWNSISVFVLFDLLNSSHSLMAAAYFPHVFLAREDDKSSIQVVNNTGDSAKNGFLAAQDSNKRRIFGGIERVPYFSRLGA
jgi:hypothetical protein